MGILKGILIVVCVVLIFMIGFIFGQFYNYFGHGFSLITGEAIAAPSVPSDVISERNIMVYGDRVVIAVEGASVSHYESSGSMAPVLDRGASGIRIVPRSADEIGVGDIVSFERDDNLIVHRVIAKEVDAEGVYFITKGDNSPLPDEEKVRFSDIRYVTIGIIY